MIVVLGASGDLAKKKTVSMSILVDCIMPADKSPSSRLCSDL